MVRNLWFYWKIKNKILRKRWNNYGQRKQGLWQISKNLQTLQKRKQDFSCLSRYEFDNFEKFYLLLWIWQPWLASLGCFCIFTNLNCFKIYTYINFLHDLSVTICNYLHWISFDGLTELFLYFFHINKQFDAITRSVITIRGHHGQCLVGNLKDPEAFAQHPIKCHTSTTLRTVINTQKVVIHLIKKKRSLMNVQVGFPFCFSNYILRKRSN